MTDALDEIIDLFAIESRAVSTEQRANGQRMARRVMLHGSIKSQAAMTRRAWLDESKRTPPTLPRVRWLERPDP